MDITINIDEMVLDKDLSGVTTLYKELYDPSDFNCNIIFSSAERKSLNLKIEFKSFYNYWELLIERSAPQTSGNYGLSFLRNIYMNVSLITFLIDIVITHKIEKDIIEFISDVTRKENGFNIFPIADR